MALDMPQMIGLLSVAQKGMICWLLVCISAVRNEYNILGSSKRKMLALNGCIYTLLASFIAGFYCHACQSFTLKYVPHSAP